MICDLSLLPAHGWCRASPPGELGPPMWAPPDDGPAVYEAEAMEWLARRRLADLSDAMLLIARYAEALRLMAERLSEIAAYALAPEEAAL